MKRLAVLPLAAVLALGTGCTRDAPVAPHLTPAEELEPPPSPGAPRLSASAEEIAGLRVALEDARERVLPALEPTGVRTRIDAALGALSAALEAADAAAATAALQAVHAALEATPGAAADTPMHALTRDVLRLVLARVEAVALQEPAGAAPATPDLRTRNVEPTSLDSGELR